MFATAVYLMCIEMQHCVVMGQSIVNFAGKEKNIFFFSQDIFTSNFSSSHIVSKDLYSRHVKTRACLGMG